MIIKNRAKLYVAIISTALFLGFINFKQGYKSIITYMNDNDVMLTKEAVFDRVFINTDFASIDYMEGKNVLHFISPFTFYMLAIFWGGFYYLLLKKDYHQLIYSRINSKQEALKIIRGPYIQNIILFVGTYVVSVFLFIYFNDFLGYIDMTKILKQSLFWVISSVLICIGLTLLMFNIYLRFSEITALLVTIITILLLFIIDLNWSKGSLVFIGEDLYFISGIISGIVLITISHLLLKNIKYEIE